MRKRSLVLLYLVWGGGLAAAQIAAPAVPENLKPPGAESILLKATGKGKQIYACQAVPGQHGKFVWVLKRPEADLLDAQGKEIGRHFEGPTWEARDGSKVTGEVLERAPSPHAGAVPWLLLKARSVEGTGLFGHVTYIQRVATVGGAAPPEGCDSAHSGAETAIDYQAEYYFYGRRQ